LQAIAALAAKPVSRDRVASGEVLSYRASARISSGSGRSGSGSYGGAALVLPIRGVIFPRANLMSWIYGGTTLDKLTAQFRQALGDSSVKTIVFDVDSPGGDVQGVPELAEEIYKSRSRKKSVAVANGMAASAAYWLASAAGELVVAPSGQVGSIGVYMAHEDISKAMEQEGLKVTLISAGKYKTDGNAIEPLSDSARADMRGKVDAFYGMFVNGVARARGASQNAVRGGFGQGRMVLAADAVKERMADRVGTMDDALARLSGDADRSGSPLAALNERRKQLDALDGPAPRLNLRLMQLDRLCRDDSPTGARRKIELLRRELDLFPG
jgi:signal peptide peptidase SppA